jgi:hypothetical protein
MTFIIQVNLLNLHFIQKILLDFFIYFDLFQHSKHLENMSFMVKKLINMIFFKYKLPAIIAIIEFEVRLPTFAHLKNLKNYCFMLQSLNSKHFTVALFFAGSLKLILDFRIN